MWSHNCTRGSLTFTRTISFSRCTHNLPMCSVSQAELRLGGKTYCTFPQGRKEKVLRGRGQMSGFLFLLLWLNSRQSEFKEEIYFDSVQGEVHEGSVDQKVGAKDGWSHCGHSQEAESNGYLPPAHSLGDGATHSEWA